MSFSLPRLSLLRLSRPLIVLCIAVASTFFVLITLIAFNALPTLGFWLYDIGFSMRTPHAPTDITILGIDEQFMAGHHAYLAPRDRLARLITIAASGHPRAIAVDVWLDSRIDFTPGGVDSQLRTALLFAKKRGVPVWLSDLPPAESEFGSIATEQFDSRRDSRGGTNAHASTIPFFRDAASGVGSVIFVPDEDGVVRWNPIEPRGLPSIPWQMARLAEPKASRAMPESRFFESISSSETSSDTPLDFCGPPGTIATYSAADWLQMPSMAPLLEGQLVFIGATFPRSEDYQRTPYSIKAGTHPMYGVELLAQATDALRRAAQDPGARQRGGIRLSHQRGGARFFDFALVFLAALLVGWSATKSTAAGFLSALVIVVLAAVAAFFSARDAGLWWSFRFHPATPFLLAMPLSASAATAWRSWIQGRELKLVRDTFGAYVGAEVLTSLQGKMPELGGETRPIAVLFCDIRGYSALAESMAHDPRALLDELNAHFTPLVAALKRRGAYVDNYVGDLVMALFGAPVSSGNFEGDVRAAVGAALDFVDLVEARNVIRRAAGQIPIEIGVGVHCGLAVVGNMGSQDHENGGRIHYTAIGDVVNVASRVESATRGQNVALLLTREVVELCDGDPQFPIWDFVASVAVKGRAAPVDVFKMATDGGKSR